MPAHVQAACGFSIEGEQILLDLRRLTCTFIVDPAILGLDFVLDVNVAEKDSVGSVFTVWACPRGRPSY